MIVRSVIKMLFAAVTAWMLTLSAAQAGEKIGLVLMHGKLGTPAAASLRALESHLESAGILVEAPEMPWSKARQFDCRYEDAMTEIDAAAKKLRARGATRIVIGGHSMGAAAALIYGARQPADGLLLLALGHSPQSTSGRTRFAASVARARDLAGAGKGDDKDAFDDYDGSKRPPAYTITTTARIYLSYFDPQGPADTMTAAGAIPAATPVLWVDGTKESEGLKSYGEKLYTAVSARAKKHVKVDAGHLDTPGAAKEAALDWLRSLK